MQLLRNGFRGERGESEGLRGELKGEKDSGRKIHVERNGENRKR